MRDVTAQPSSPADGTPGHTLCAPVPVWVYRGRLATGSGALDSTGLPLLLESLRLRRGAWARSRPSNRSVAIDVVENLLFMRGELDDADVDTFCEAYWAQP